jgi:hypothetical protein
MGLSASTVEGIVREHKYKPIRGDVLLIGRQTVYLTQQQYIAMLRQHGVDVHEKQLKQMVIDNETMDRRLVAIAPGQELISDRSLFHLLGVEQVRALDHSAYEGAEILHDLNTPLPKELEGIADFIIDGSTLDNLFDPALALRNLTKLLRPGGRLILINMLSTHHEPYTVPSALWYLDYFVVNAFLDCKAYISVYYPHGPNVFCINLDCLADPKLQVSNFVSSDEASCIVFAEKGPNSTTDAWATQGHYRSEPDWRTYRQRLAPIRSNPRPHILRSFTDIGPLDVRAGHLYVSNDYVACDPFTERKRLEAAIAVAEKDG